MVTFPIASLHATSKSPNRSFKSIFQFRLTTPSSQPSGSNPSKKGNIVFDSYTSSVKGNVNETAAFQECVHSQSYSYMLDTICSPVERNDILYQWKTDEHLLRRNTFIGNCYNEFQERKDAPTLLRVMMANYILEGIYFYSGFMFFYNLSRNGRCPAQRRRFAT